jgi:hypothetical protein
MAMALLSGCCSLSESEKAQDAAFKLKQPPYRHFEQVEGDELHPAAYYTCGQNTCHSHLKKSANRIYKPYSFKNEIESNANNHPGGK